MATASVEGMKCETSHNSGARVLVISQRAFRPTVCRTSGYEFEDVIAGVDEVDLLVPVPRETASRLTTKVLKTLQPLNPLDMSLKPRPERVQVRGEYDLCFVLVQTPRDLQMLESVRGWREASRVAVCWIDELWRLQLRKKSVLADIRRYLKGFDHVFLSCHQTIEDLSLLVDAACHWGVPAVDALRFCPYPASPERIVDLYSMGRRSSVGHRLLLERARKEDFFYFYNSATFGVAADPRQHRELLANVIKRSRFFLANKSKIDEPELRGDQEEAGFRFFEGAAGGAVLIGERPLASTFDQCMGWQDALIHLPYDSPQILDLIGQLESDPDRLQNISRRNVSHSLLRHDWVYRWQKVLAAGGLAELPALGERINRLEKLARSIPVAAGQAMPARATPGSEEGMGEAAH